MAAKFYTLVEARALLPRVREMMHQAQQARQEIMRLRPVAWPALRDAATNGGSQAAGELFMQFSRLETNLKGIMALGITIKDVDSGLVDFLGRRNGRDIYLCWRYGEDDIRFWHDIDAGFAGRRPIDAEIQ
ncbi:MAG: DUF2203 domain-containing protein [Caldilineaceae bacterium]|nr:DUF2203 domain-containing protein [Caldilineaceae bacterium]